MEQRARVTLTKAQCETVAGRELVALLVQLSADGEVTRDELAQLRAWLEVDRGVQYPAFPFLHETIEQISVDGEITDAELDRLALAVERVLPKELRAEAAAQRKANRAQLLLKRREAYRAAVIADRQGRQKRRATTDATNRILFRREFAVRGAFRSAERREACGQLIAGDVVSFEREPDNPHDSKAIVVVGRDGCELGYVPRDHAAVVAPLLDSGASAEALVGRVWETPDGQFVPILAVKVTGTTGASTTVTTRRSASKRPGCGCVSAASLLVLVVATLIVFALGSGSMR